MKTNTTIIVPVEDRLKAINELATGMRILAQALQHYVQVNVSDCHFEGCDVGLEIKPQEVEEELNG
jgi:hypothetical protein